MGEAMWASKLFGAQVVPCSSPDAPQSTETALGPDPPYVGIYFSFANISSDSDHFTQQLIQWYCSTTPPRVQIVQVVLWALSDLVPDYQASYRGALQGLPWYAVPFHNVDIKRELSGRYNIKVGAPCLVVVERGGSEISRPTLDLLAHRGEGFPWRPPPLSALLRDTVLHPCSQVDGGSNVVKYSDLPEDSVKAFYFGAYWCPPCKVFTPQLCETYTQLKAKGKDFHVIYISSDRSQESFDRGMEGMPWLCVQWRDEETRREVARTLGVEGIPALRMVGGGREGGGYYEARAQAQGDPEGLNFPWLPSPVSMLTEYHLQRLRQHPAIILFVDNEEEEISFAMSVLRPAAEAYYEEWCIRHPSLPPPYLPSTHQDSIDFHYAQHNTNPQNKKTTATLDFLIATDTEACECVREMCHLEECVPLLTAVDCVSGRLTIMELGEPITTTSVQHFLDLYLAGQLPHQPITLT